MRTNQSARALCQARNLAAMLALVAAFAQTSTAAEPRLEGSKSGEGILLSWSADGFLLESATNVAGPWTAVAPTPNSPYTAPIEDSSQVFFRLRQVASVTVGIFKQETNGTYTAAGPELVFAISSECQTWTRTAQPHGSYSTTHLHYNAADDTSYVNGTFTWTEYGPAHSQEEIDDTCAAGVGGVTKSVNATDYYEDHEGVFLKITKVE